MSSLLLAFDPHGLWCHAHAGRHETKSVYWLISVSVYRHWSQLAQLAQLALAFGVAGVV